MNVLLTVLTLLLVVVPSLILTIVLSIVGAASRKRLGVRYFDKSSLGMKVTGMILTAASFLLYVVTYFSFNRITVKTVFWGVFGLLPMVLMFLHFAICHGKKPATLPAIALLCLCVTAFRSASIYYTRLGLEDFFSNVFPALFRGSLLLTAGVPMLVSGSKRRHRVFALITLCFSLLSRLLNIYSRISILSGGNFSDAREADLILSTLNGIAIFTFNVVMIIYLFGKTQAPAVLQPPYAPAAPIPNIPGVPVPPIPNIPVPPIPGVNMQPEQPEPAFCPHCGNPRTPDQAFCQYCGGRLD